MRRLSGTGTINAGGYICVRQNNQYQYEHIKIAETVLGERLPKGAQVHHVDCNPSNNNPSNLVICPNQQYHRLLHRRSLAFDACGNASFVKCRYCEKYGDQSEFLKDGPRSFAHQICRSNYRRSIYLERKANGKSV